MQTLQSNTSASPYAQRSQTSYDLDNSVENSWFCAHEDCCALLPANAAAATLWSQVNVIRYLITQCVNVYNHSLVSVCRLFLALSSRNEYRTVKVCSVAHLVADFCLDLLHGSVWKHTATSLQVTEPASIIGIVFIYYSYMSCISPICITCEVAVFIYVFSIF